MNALYEVIPGREISANLKILSSARCCSLPGKELRVPVSELLAEPNPLPAAGDFAQVHAQKRISALRVRHGSLDAEQAERAHILRALQQTQWRIGGPKGAAALLDMKRTTLQARMRKLNIRRPV